MSSAAPLQALVIAGLGASFGEEEIERAAGGGEAVDTELDQRSRQRKRSRSALDGEGYGDGEDEGESGGLQKASVKGKGVGKGKAGGGGRERKRGRKKGGCIKTVFQKEGLNRKKRLYPSTNPTPLKKRDKLKVYE